VNPQTHFQNFKNEIAGQTRARAKVTVPKINLQIQVLTRRMYNPFEETGC
jgi:hypothetical protein